jgi:hypothetical protein
MTASQATASAAFGCDRLGGVRIVEVRNDLKPLVTHEKEA